ncbi:Glu/Leu/Phe/Val dehydrogenase dimerization domain-containing protein [Altericroceibacterium endophyticum]|uniref:Amino acid dehydrogenase n=1 Tax=Altericroceibacterium endophyticum TaxID=1808508 RepID=A0A6I4T380_9SPHN|nr:Glu/Leu/Phe/Val dehydrogenase dimerization domain-containing protein [Altericroceibacterium endophyticum]MXO64742.1 amino acid dehydrogenase [Altericroceibacterium endophyticum]
MLMQSADQPGTEKSLDVLEPSLTGIVAFHAANPRPAMGGCFLHKDASAETARNLARSTSATYAFAGLPFSGAAAVVSNADDWSERSDVFRAVGRATAELHGAFILSENFGTKDDDLAQAARETMHVTAPSTQGQHSPAYYTALGIMRAMEVAARHRLGKSLSQTTIAVQGVGAVGFALCALLNQSGARLIISERDSVKAAKAAVRFNAELVNCRRIHQMRADIFAPCGQGDAITTQNMHEIRARIICGAAENQLAAPELAEDLAERNILYCPDYVVNAGGAIRSAGHYLGWSEMDIERRVLRIAPALQALLDQAVSMKETPSSLAAAMIHPPVHAEYPQQHTKLPVQSEKKAAA